MTVSSMASTFAVSRRRHARACSSTSGVIPARSIHASAASYSESGTANMRWPRISSTPSWWNFRRMASET